MKNAKKLITFFLALSMILTLLCVGVSASVTGKVGQNVTANISVPNTYGMDGTITLSNPGLFSDYSFSSNIGGSVTKEKFYVFGDVKTTAQITLRATISPNAKPGDSCTITLSGNRTINDDGKTETFTASETVVIIADEKPPVTVPPATPKPTNPPVSPIVTSTPKPTKAPTAPPYATNRPTATPGGPVSTPAPVTVDYSELNRQIEIAESLQKDGYSDDSWSAMTDALNAAKKLRSSQSQNDVDGGAQKLKEAIANLKKVDYSKLKEAIANAQELLNSDLVNLQNQFQGAVDNANRTLSSGNQAEIDQATADLNAAIDALKKYLESNVSEIIKEVPVEVEPDGPFCNISIHKVWPILFFVSLFINIVFIVLLVLWLLRRKKNKEDDTPLVDYQIYDDTGDNQ